MSKDHLIKILTEDHYLPGPPEDFLKYITDYFEESLFTINKNELAQETYDVFHKESDLSLFQLYIRQHNDNCSLMQVLDQKGSIKLMTTISNKPFLKKIVSGAQTLYVVINNYKNWRSKNTSEVNIDLQQSGYTLTKEEATIFGTVIAKMAALEGLSIKDLTDISFKFSFNARKTE